MENRVRSQFEIDLNQFLLNPFHLKPVDIKKPWEKLNEQDQEKYKTNFMVDYGLFYWMIYFSPNCFHTKEDDIFHVCFMRKLPELEARFNEAEGYKVKQLYPYLTFDFELFHRSKFTTPELQFNKNLHKIENRHSYLVDIGNVRINNVNAGEGFYFKDRSVEEIQEFRQLIQTYSKMLFNIICIPGKYPYYDIKDDCIELVIPQKYHWPEMELHNEKK